MAKGKRGDNQRRKLEARLQAARAKEAKRRSKLAKAEASKGPKVVAKRSKQLAKASARVALLSARLAALEATSAVTASAAVEARALEFMKLVAHPHLLTTFGIWHRDDVLIIGMELADETLMDRLRRANHEGHPGIPGEELLEYAREAAKDHGTIGERSSMFSSGLSGPQ